MSTTTIPLTPGLFTAIFERAVEKFGPMSAEGLLAICEGRDWSVEEIVAELTRLAAEAVR